MVGKGCLFFSFYGDHLDLHVSTHSFSTRRSSDLGGGGDGEDSMPRPTHRLRRAAGRDEFDAVTDERGGEVGKARLVADGQERAADGNEIGHGESLNWDGKDADPDRKSVG